MDSKKRGEFYEKNIMHGSYSGDAVYHDTGRYYGRRYGYL